MENFGKIKNKFNEILVEGVVSGNNPNKLLFKKYVKTIKENEILKTQFLIYNNIENKVEENEFKATEFVKANIELLDKYSKKEIAEANLKLLTPIILEKSAEYSLKELHENISKLIFTKKTPENIDSIVETTSNIVGYIRNNLKNSKVVNEAIELPNSMLSTIMVDKYNEKYSTISESDKNIIKILIDSNDDDEKKNIYKTTMKECLELINERLIESDLETKDKLLRVKEKLLNDSCVVNEDFIKNISKLVELRNNLMIS
jgi:hypothetical protein